jgi:hypothetical protein
LVGETFSSDRFVQSGDQEVLRYAQRCFLTA